MIFGSCGIGFAVGRLDPSSILLELFVDVALSVLLILFRYIRMELSHLLRLPLVQFLQCGESSAASVTSFCCPAYSDWYFLAYSDRYFCAYFSSYCWLRLSWPFSA